MAKSLTNRSRSLLVAGQVEEAKSFSSRLKGLLGRNGLAPSHALWIEPCNSIHTFFMRFPIDAVFVDQELVVRKVVRNLHPWRLIAPVWGAQSVFELGAGQATPDKVSEGDQLHVGD